VAELLALLLNKVVVCSIEHAIIIARVLDENIAAIA
jgi:hypothetical protein